MINQEKMTEYDDLFLTVRRVIPARAERLFEAWTKPDLLTQWWGPESVSCTSAEIDLRVGGRYRIANQMENGDTLWISGVFEIIEKPRRLVYTWHLDPDLSVSERVHVFFESREDATEVVIVHERIPSRAIMETHHHGWEGCLDGLAALLNRS